MEKQKPKEGGEGPQALESLGINWSLSISLGFLFPQESSEAKAPFQSSHSICQSVQGCGSHPDIP